MRSLDQSNLDELDNNKLDKVLEQNSEQSINQDSKKTESHNSFEEDTQKNDLDIPDIDGLKTEDDLENEMESHPVDEMENPFEDWSPDVPITAIPDDVKMPSEDEINSSPEPEFKKHPINESLPEDEEIVSEVLPEGETYVEEPEAETIEQLEKETIPTPLQKDDNDENGLEEAFTTNTALDQQATQELASELDTFEKDMSSKDSDEDESISKNNESVSKTTECDKYETTMGTEQIDNTLSAQEENTADVDNPQLMLDIAVPEQEEQSIQEIKDANKEDLQNNTHLEQDNSTYEQLQLELNKNEKEQEQVQDIPQESSKDEQTDEKDSDFIINDDEKFIVDVAPEREKDLFEPVDLSSSSVIEEIDSQKEEEDIFAQSISAPQYKELPLDQEIEIISTKKSQKKDHYDFSPNYDYPENPIQATEESCKREKISKNIRNDEDPVFEQFHEQFFGEPARDSNKDAVLPEIDIEKEIFDASETPETKLENSKNIDDLTRRIAASGFFGRKKKEAPQEIIVHNDEVMYTPIKDEGLKIDNNVEPTYQESPKQDLSEAFKEDKQLSENKVELEEFIEKNEVEDVVTEVQIEEEPIGSVSSGGSYAFEISSPDTRSDEENDLFDELHRQTPDVPLVNINDRARMYDEVKEISIKEEISIEELIKKYIKIRSSSMGLPTRIWTFFISFFFGIFGVIPAAMGEIRAVRKKAPENRYWLTLICGLILGFIFSVIIYSVFDITLFYSSFLQGFK